MIAGEAESQKGQRALKILFADDNVTQALGAAGIKNEGSVSKTMNF